jgi:hypothetical protein
VIPGEKLGFCWRTGEGKEEGDGADRRARAVSEGVGERGCRPSRLLRERVLGRVQRERVLAGARCWIGLGRADWAGGVALLAGPARLDEGEAGSGRTGPRVRKWAGLFWVWVMGSFSISFSFLFLIQTKFEFNYKF